MSDLDAALERALAALGEAMVDLGEALTVRLTRDVEVRTAQIRALVEVLRDDEVRR